MSCSTPKQKEYKVLLATGSCNGKTTEVLLFGHQNKALASAKFHEAVFARKATGMNPKLVRFTYA
jgi:hypothetical protein